MNKPILFNTEMVKAIQDGRKTQTRRVLKLKYKENEAGFQILTNTQDGSFAYAEYYDEYERPTRMITPPCMPGSILWVRETWCNAHPNDPFDRFYYKADMPMHWDAEDTAHGEAVDITEADFRWHPSIHMPKEAARIFLRVEDVRVERLREISADDAMDEGFDDWNDFVTLWDTTIKPADRDQYGWNANPWVWVIEFERCERPADFL